MKIGLVRHFKANHPFPKKSLCSKSDVITWFETYNKTDDLQYKDVDLQNIEWKKCYSSSMKRAVHTAHHIFRGEISTTDVLQELNILHQLPDKLKLPFLVWGLLVRIKSFSSNKDTGLFRNNIIAFLDKIIATHEGDVLIVSHWFVMRTIRQHLIQSGFTGSDFKSNEYGVLYVFENTAQQTKTR